MKLNYFTKPVAALGRALATGLMVMIAIAFVWQGAFFAKTTAMAAPVNGALVATMNNDGLDEAKSDNKGFVRDAAKKVKETASKNASKVREANDNSGNAVQRKAEKDAAWVQKRADQDADRTQRAIDKNLNAVERTVDNIKDAFGK